MSYTIDMMERYLLMNNPSKKNKYTQNVLDEQALIFDVYGANIELTDDFSNFEVNLGNIMLSIVENINQTPIWRLDDLGISNKRNANTFRNKDLEQSKSEYKFVNQEDYKTSEDSHDEVSLKSIFTQI